MKRVCSLVAVTMAAVSLQALAQPPHANNPGKEKGAAPASPHNQHRGADAGRHDHEDKVEDAVSLALAGIALSRARELAHAHDVIGAKPLPPGIRKNLARGKPLPPGIARQSIPRGMWEGLPHYDGYEWRRYGTDLVLVYLASDLIADVLVDVFQ